MLTMEPFWLGSQTKIQEIKVFRNRLDVNILWIGKYGIGSWDWLLNIRQIHILFNFKSQNMATNCLLLYFSPFLPEFTCFAQKNCFVLMFRTIFGTKKVNSGKNGEKHRSKQTIAFHVLA